MTINNWSDSSVNSTNYTDTSVISNNYSNANVISNNYTDTSVNSNNYGGVLSYILASSTEVTAGSTAYDARGLLVGTDPTYSTDWSTA